ncbi:hypothetical protein CO033_00850 [Candidatus Nomurabacteria bacterium CG_4_9_14_0_2_um_filter_32_10]|uniref:HD domain-containing protein n=3 Tax=Candidatus Nomuraibacteriota TaxID=1752729 RepID=A0A2H0CG30_9BACT|nr:MAG: hypothetical protein COW91_02370 [Candidatus Nomurabacteria bacterium CG22_combo_CG10-13_8_21_14_all_32_8]PIZ86489.1 MAG: hypothetical protein COX94_00040 [Candidatus Nomurabacteria bacterium CG_4_10_14_0_2_um_filter_33_9]PJC49545.1 MAG: hypothetical protein CO033_00850 [Candidatus Nomurabacteria bacterium CG_4_9_14_0_2_um_filter_32_10]
MLKLFKLKRKINKLYKAKNDNRDEWADYLFTDHIYLVAKIAKKFSKKYNANKKLVIASALLHDIADAVMPRENIAYEEKSYEIAKDFLTASGFSEKEIEIIVNDALRYHSCHNGEIPKTIEGKILATADAYAHLISNFYENRIIEFARRDSLQKAKEWALLKIDRDLYNKILFDKIKEEAKPRYEFLKNYINDLKS